MKKIVDFLAPAGLLIVVGAIAWSRSRTLPGKMEYYLIAALVLIVAHIVLRWEDVVAVLGRRQTQYGANTAVLTLAVVGILGLVNCPGLPEYAWTRGLVHRFDKRWDLTKNQRYSLSDQTKKVVSSLSDEVKVTYFQRTAAMGPASDHLKEYTALSPKIKAEFVDPYKEPSKAQKYDVKGPWPILIVERGTVREKAGSDSEQDLTNAIIKVTRDRKRTVCFAEGEGERDTDDGGDEGYSFLKTSLEKSQYEIKKVPLLREKKIPESCTVFVLAGPQKDLLGESIDALRSFVKGGGKLFVLIEPELKESFPHITDLLKEWNIETAKDIVVDASGMGQFFGTGPLTPLVMEYPYHEITKNFRVASAFHTARSVQAGTATVPGVVVQNLAMTSEKSWAETDLTLKEPIEMNEGKDRLGPISLAAVATLREPEPAPSASPSPGDEAKPPKPEGRVVVFGDSDVASNALLGFQGNKDLVLNTVAWLSEDKDLISIRPKDPADQRLSMTVEQEQGVFWLSNILFPGLFIVAGVATWWLRR